MATSLSYRDSLSYREWPPPEDLSAWIACFWQIRGAVGDGFQHRILPDGCADLLFDLQAARHGGAPGEIVGPMTCGQLIELRSGVDLLGVRLRPGAVAALLGIAADRLVDVAVDIHEAPAVLRIDSMQLADLPDVAARVALLTAAFRARLEAVDNFDRVVRAALSRFSTAHSATRVGFPKLSVLTRDLGLSERAFERRFVAQVGLTPVRFRRLARLRSVLRRFSEAGGEWARLADEAGFSDQSHLVRDFREFVGLTPTQWAATQRANAGFLQDGRISAL